MVMHIWIRMGIGSRISAMMIRLPSAGKLSFWDKSLGKCQDQESTLRNDVPHQRNSIGLSAALCLLYAAISHPSQELPSEWSLQISQRVTNDSHCPVVAHG